MTAFPICTSLLSLSVQSWCRCELTNHSVIETVISRTLELHNQQFFLGLDLSVFHTWFGIMKSWENLTFHCSCSFLKGRVDQSGQTKHDRRFWNTFKSNLHRHYSYLTTYNFSTWSERGHVFKGKSVQILWMLTLRIVLPDQAWRITNRAVI